MNIETKLQLAYKKYAEEVECDIDEVAEILREEWGEGGDKGYGIFTSDDTDVLHIERIDELWFDDGNGNPTRNVYDLDLDAAKQAEKDGIKLIHDIRIPKDHIIYPLNDTCIDTPENRKQLLKEIKEW